MLTTDAIKFFRTKTKLAEVAGVSQAAVSRWVKIGFIPQGSAAILSSASLGALNFDRGFYQRLKSERMRQRKAKREGALIHENHP
ncbi:Cro/CI family transcriptional regulator [Enterobacteriaceae bacterium ESL0689]|nr:Cro/CI family transcriptional regulator [Enterobacteriaceae bacterium ESL0689]